MPDTMASTLLERSCIRKYAARAGSMEELAFMTTPTNSNVRQFSVTEVTKRGLRDETAVPIGQKPPEYVAADFKFLSDFSRMSC